MYFFYSCSSSLTRIDCLKKYIFFIFRRQQRRKRRSREGTNNNNSLRSYLNIIMLDLRFCGPKLSIFGILVSIWGIIQLSLMALAFHSKSIAVVEDLNFNETIVDPKNPEDYKLYKNRMEDSFDIQALNCAIAAGIYVVTLLVSYHQYWLNNRATASNRYQRHYWLLSPKVLKKTNMMHYFGTSTQASMWACKTALYAWTPDQTNRCIIQYILIN